MNLRWPRRRWGIVITYTKPGRKSFTDIGTCRFWTRAGAVREAALQWRACMDIDPEVEWSVEAKPLTPVPNIYADRYWRGDTYVGPEI